MMKKTLVLGMSLIVASMSYGKDYGAAGCGVGAMLFEGQSGLGPHVLAATTNGFYGTQTFAMTSGTLGCDVNGTIQAHASLNLINGNMEQIAQSIAVGEGEGLVALADSLEVVESDRQAFNDLLSSNFSVIYSNDKVTGLEVYSSIMSLLSSSEELAQYSS